MTMWRTDLYPALKAVLDETQGFTITVRQKNATTGVSVTARDALGDQLGSVDAKQERNFVGVSESALGFEPQIGDYVIDENGEHGQIIKAARQNTGTWRLQVWRIEDVL